MPDSTILIDYLQARATALVEAAREAGCRLVVDGLEGRRSLEVITAIYESIESGREVRFPFTVSYSRLGKPEGHGAPT